MLLLLWLAAVRGGTLKIEGLGKRANPNPHNRHHETPTLPLQQTPTLTKHTPKPTPTLPVTESTPIPQHSVCTFTADVICSKRRPLVTAGLGSGFLMADLTGAG